MVPALPPTIRVEFAIVVCVGWPRVSRLGTVPRGVSTLPYRIWALILRLCLRPFLRRGCPSLRCGRHGYLYAVRMFVTTFDLFLAFAVRLCRRTVEELNCDDQPYQGRQEHHDARAYIIHRACTQSRQWPGSDAEGWPPLLDRRIVTQPTGSEGLGASTAELFSFELGKVYDRRDDSKAPAVGRGS